MDPFDAGIEKDFEVTSLATAAGRPARRRYFDIDRGGNASSACLLIATHGGVRERVIGRPMGGVAPGVGAGGSAATS